MADLANSYALQEYGTEAYGDLLMVGGDLVLTADADPRGTNHVGQDIVMRLRTFLGEPFTAQTLGVPYYQQLLGQKTPARTWAAVLQAVVLTTPGVTQLTQWSSTPDYRRRTLTISFSAATTSGTVDYADTIDLNVSG